MTNVQLYFAIGVPVFAIVAGILAGILQMNSIGMKITNLETNINARFTSLENRFSSLENRFDTLLAKLSKSITA